MRIRRSDAKRIAKTIAPAYAAMGWTLRDGIPTVDHLAEMIVDLAKGVNGKTISAATGGLTVRSDRCDGCEELNLTYAQCKERRVTVTFGRTFDLPGAGLGAGPRRLGRAAG